MLYQIDGINNNDECSHLTLKEYLVKAKNNTSGVFANILERTRLKTMIDLTKSKTN